MAFLMEFFFQFEVVFDDSVVHHDDLSAAVAVRMRIFFGWAAMGGPARVADSVRAFDGRFGDDLFEVSELAWGTPNLQLAVLGDNGDSRRIVAAVFQLAQTFDDDGDNFLRADVADNSAHAGLSWRRF